MQTKTALFLTLVSCVLSVLLGLVIARGGAAASTVNQRPIIGLSMDTLASPRWQVDRDLFVKRANELGADVLVQSANSDDTRQIADVQALISRNIDALVIIPHNGAAMGKAVDLARAAGIPVLAYDRLITGVDLDLYITFDNVRVGELQAQFAVDRLLAQGKKRIVRVYGAKTDNNAFLFKEGQDRVLDPLIKNGQIEVVHEDWAANWKPENAKKIINAAITKAGPTFDAIIDSYDGTAGGSIQALIEEGFAGKILVTGQDAELAACQRIANGTQAMTIYKPIKNLAARGAEAAVRLATGRPLVAPSLIDNGKIKVPTILLEVVSVSADNLRETVIADGFQTAADVYGEKASQP